MSDTLLEAPRKRPLLISIMAFILAVEGVVWFILGSLAFFAVITNGSFNVYGASAAADSIDIISVTGDYPGEYPWPFTGTVKRVVVDVSGEGSIHLEREAHGMLMRD